VADAGLLADPTVSMGLGPLAAIYQAQFMRTWSTAA
jgi:pyruvate dehydrogenase complex dehydrogenase (E1) component